MYYVFKKKQEKTNDYLYKLKFDVRKSTRKKTEQLSCIIFVYEWRDRSIPILIDTVIRHNENKNKT